jgi:hypothetical protein
MPFIGPLSFVLPETPMHGVISCSFRPIFAKLQVITLLGKTVLNRGAGGAP